MTTALATFVTAGRNGDGGWGYYAGKVSRLEPTCWAVLSDAGGEGAGRDRLRTWPTRDGLLLERRDGSVNVAFHALALAVLTHLGLEHAVSNDVLALALSEVRGVALGKSDINRQDNDLQGWPWVADTFSWVEPTSWAIVALETWARGSGRRPTSDRVDEGIRLLLDRVCREGGWNYGNSNMLGTELHPHAPTTAVALLALQRRAADEPVRRSLAWLEAHAVSEPSAMTLALVALALRAYGKDDSVVRAAILERVPVSLALGNYCSLAAASYVLDHVGGPSAFSPGASR